MLIRIFTDTFSEDFLAVYNLYRSIFPDENEAEDLEGLRAQDALEGNAELVSRYGRFRQFWMVLYEGGKPKSGVNFQVFRIPEHKATTIHICYIFTAKDSRGKGYASELLERIDSLGADAVFIEVDDPKKMPEEVMEESIRCSGITPKKRLSWWKHRGYVPLDFPYVQPPLSADKQPADWMLLAVKTRKKKLLNELLSAHLRRFFYLAVLKNRTPEDKPVEEYLTTIKNVQICKR